MRKRVTLLLGLLIVLSFALAACGSAAPELVSVPEGDTSRYNLENGWTLNVQWGEDGMIFVNVDVGIESTFTFTPNHMSGGWDIKHDDTVLANAQTEFRGTYEGIRIFEMVDGNISVYHIP